MSILFTPLKINGLELKNRIVMPAMQLRLGMGNPRAQAYYLARAQGGVGAIIMSATAVDLLCRDEAWGRPDGVARFVEKMRAFTSLIRANGARIGIQLWHGNQFPAGNGGDDPNAAKVAPSAVEECRALTIGEIQAIIARFGQAAATAQAAGFDFVEVHGAHGYLVCQFFSGADNQRIDAYGGDLAGRMRFGLDVAQAMRAAVGPAFPIFFRLGAQEERPGGVTLDQSKPYAAALQQAGVDAFGVSIGKAKGRKASPLAKAKTGTFVPLAQAIKTAVAVPVMAVGRINILAAATAALEIAGVDLVGVGRQLIADPQWPNKMRDGRGDQITACLSCNTCFTPLDRKAWKPGDPICKVNPRAGREVDSEGVTSGK